MKILGIDPGTAITGWAIIEKTGDSLSPIAYGHISTENNQPDDVRIVEIASDLEKIITKYQPEEASVESLFYFKNKKTVIQVAQSRGAILLTLCKKSVRVFGYTPLQIKQAITGYGRADKQQMQQMTKHILRLGTLPKPDDVADALAIAICHANSQKLINLTKNYGLS